MIDHLVLGLGKTKRNLACGTFKEKHKAKNLKTAGECYLIIFFTEVSSCYMLYF